MTGEEHGGQHGAGGEESRYAAACGSLPAPLLCTVLERVDEAIAILDASSDECIVQWANQRAGEMRGRPGAPLAGLPFASAFPEAASAGLLAMCREVRETGRPCETEILPIRGLPLGRRHEPSGDVSFWRWKCEHLLRGEEHLILIVGTNITEAVRRERLEQEAAALGQQAEHRVTQLEATLQSLVNGVIILDAEGRQLFANDVARSLLDGSLQPERSLLPQLAGRLCRADGTPVAAGDSPLEHALRGESVQDFRAILGAQRGDERYLSITATPVRDRQGQVIGAVSVFQDITDRELREREQNQVAAVAHALVLTRTLDEVAAAVVRGTREALRAHTVTLWVVDAEGQALRLLADYGIPEETRQEAAHVPLDAPALSAEAFLSGQVRAVEDIRALSDRYAMTRRILEREGVRSVLVSPLRADGVTLGILVWSRAAPHRFSAREMELTSTLADLFAAALVNARLYDEAQERRNILEETIAHAPFAIALTEGPQHRILMVNAMYGRITGKGEAGVGKTFAEACPTVVRGGLIAIMDRVWRSGEPISATDFALDLGPPRGLTYWTFASVPVKGADEQARYIVHMMIETTEQVRARQRLEELLSQARQMNASLVQQGTRLMKVTEEGQRRTTELDTVIESIPDAVIVIDAEGNIRLLNQAALALTGAEQLGRPRTVAEYLATLRLRTPEGRPITVEQLALTRSLHGETVRGLEESGTHPLTGRRVEMMVSAAPLRDEEGRVVGAVHAITDITQRVEAERLREDFIAVAGHELRTPLTVIKGQAQTLTRRTRRDGANVPTRKALASLQHAIARLETMVRAFMEAVEMERDPVLLHRSSMDLVKLAQTVRAEMQETTPRHRIRVVPGQARLYGEWDREALREVLRSLLDNAIRYSPQGGDVLLMLSRKNEDAEFCVKDQGIGIPPEDQAHLFERFFRGHLTDYRHYPGLGLGLYVANRIVRAHGGRIWAESQVGVGSSFCVTLPLRAKAKVAAPAG